MNADAYTGLFRDSNRGNLPNPKFQNQAPPLASCKPDSKKVIQARSLRGICQDACSQCVTDSQNRAARSMVRGQVFRLVAVGVGVRFLGLWAMVGLRMVEGFECWKH